MGALGWAPGPRGRPWPARLKEPSTCRAVPRPLLFGAPEEPQPLALNGQTVQKPEGWGAAPARPPWLVKGPRPDAAKTPGAPPASGRPAPLPPALLRRGPPAAPRFALTEPGSDVGASGWRGGASAAGAGVPPGGSPMAPSSPTAAGALRRYRPAGARLPAGRAALGRGGAARGGLAGAPGFWPRAGKREATKGKCQGTKSAAGEGLVSPRGAFSCGVSLRERQWRSPETLLLNTPG